MANAHYGKGEHDNAIECWKKALDIKPDKIETWYNIAVLYYELEKFDLSIEYCKKALEIKPDSSVLQRLLNAATKGKEDT